MCMEIGQGNGKFLSSLRGAEREEVELFECESAARQDVQEVKELGEFVDMTGSPLLQMRDEFDEMDGKLSDGISSILDAS